MWLGSPLSDPLIGCSIYTSLSKSPFRKALEISTLSSSISSNAASAKMLHDAAHLAIGAKVSL